MSCATTTMAYHNFNMVSFDRQSELALKEQRNREIDSLAEALRMKNLALQSNITVPPVFANPAPVFTTAPSVANLSDDWQSVQGHFGWAEIHRQTLPYVTRADKKYVSVRMIEMKLFNKFKNKFADEVVAFPVLNRVAVTKAEANLLNDINRNHCDFYYGTQQFDLNELLVSLDDVIDLYNYFKFCRFRLIKNNHGPHRRAGFIKINENDNIPFVRSARDGKVYVPLLYIHDDIQCLEEKATELTGWDLVYLKFCCLCQGVRKSHYDLDSLKALDWEFVKKFFPPDTEFSEFWAPCRVEGLLKKPQPEPPAPAQIPVLETSRKRPSTEQTAQVPNKKAAGSGWSSVRNAERLANGAVVNGYTSGVFQPQLTANNAYQNAGMNYQAGADQVWYQPNGTAPNSYQMAYNQAVYGRYPASATSTQTGAVPNPPALPTNPHPNQTGYQHVTSIQNGTVHASDGYNYSYTAGNFSGVIGANQYATQNANRNFVYSSNDSDSRLSANMSSELQNTYVANRNQQRTQQGQQKGQQGQQNAFASPVVTNQQQNVPSNSQTIPAKYYQIPEVFVKENPYHTLRAHMMDNDKLVMFTCVNMESNKTDGDSLLVATDEIAKYLKVREPDLIQAVAFLTLPIIVPNKMQLRLLQRHSKSSKNTIRLNDATKYLHKIRQLIRGE